jgi:hypothetical protein
LPSLSSVDRFPNFGRNQPRVWATRRFVFVRVQLEPTYRTDRARQIAP